MIRVTEATQADVPVILDFIKRLAEFEKLSNEVIVTPELLARHLFGSNPAARVLLAESAGKKIGFALFFTNFSTFLGKPGFYLEDLFVLPEARGQGAGKMLLTKIAAMAIEFGYGRLDWSVLDWNKSAIDFYEGIGAKPLSDWVTYRLTGGALSALAQN